MKSAVLVFPGINRERDMARALKLVAGSRAGHGLARRDRAARGHRSRRRARRLLLRRLSALRRHRGAFAGHGCGARHARRMAALVLGVCNGFQILCEAGLLPGILMRNAKLKFLCQDVHLRVERSDTPFTRGYNAGQVIRVPIAHGEGNYTADAETLKRLEGDGRVLYRYCSPTASVDDGATSMAPRIDRRHRQRERQRARHDAASGKSRRRHHGLHRRPRAVRGPRRASGARCVMRLRQRFVPRCRCAVCCRCVRARR